MFRLPRFLLLPAIAATAAIANANGISLINHDAMATYHAAVSEGNRVKAAAMIKGLLLGTVTIGIDKSTLPPKDFEFQDGIRNAVDIWNAQMDESPFRLVKGDQKPDILVRFVDRIDDADHAQGLIQAERHFFWKGSTATARTDGTVSIRSTSLGQLMSEDEVTRVMTHELGHLLGLDDDHDGTGAMSDFVPGPGIRTPSRQEVEDVLQFRSMLKDALRTTQNGR